MQSRSRTIILKVSITCQHQLCLFVSLFIDASGNYKAEEKPPVVSYKETGSEVEKDDKPVPDASFNEGMFILFIFSYKYQLPLLCFGVKCWNFHGN